MWGRDVLAAALLLGSATFSVAEQPMDFDGFNVDRESSVAQPTEARDFIRRRLGLSNSGAHIVGIPSGPAAGADDDYEEIVLDVPIPPGIGDPPASEDNPGENGAAVVSPSAQSSTSARGKSLIAFGSVLLLIGILLSLAASRLPPAAHAHLSPAKAALQTTAHVMDKLGVKAATNLSTGIILAGLMDMAGSLTGGRKNNSQSAQKASKPKLRGHMLLLLAVAAFIASLVSSGIDISHLKVPELIRIILEYASKTHIGLFFAGGASMLSSIYEMIQYERNQRRPPVEQGGNTLQGNATEKPAGDEHSHSEEGVLEITVGEANEKQAENGATDINRPSKTFFDMPSNSGGSSDGAEDEAAEGAEGGPLQEVASGAEDAREAEVAAEDTAGGATAAPEGLTENEAGKQVKPEYTVATGDASDEETGRAGAEEDASDSDDSTEKEREAANQDESDQGADEDVSDEETGREGAAEDATGRGQPTEKEQGGQTDPDQSAGKEGISDAETVAEGAAEVAAGHVETTEQGQGAGGQIEPDQDATKADVSVAEAVTEGGAEGPVGHDETTEQVPEAGKQEGPDQGVTKEEASEANAGADVPTEDTSVPEVPTEKDQEAGEAKPDEDAATEEVPSAEAGTESTAGDASAPEVPTERDQEAGEESKPDQDAATGEVPSAEAGTESTVGDASAPEVPIEKDQEAGEEAEPDQGAATEAVSSAEAEAESPSESMPAPEKATEPAEEAGKQTKPEHNPDVEQPVGEATPPPEVDSAMSAEEVISGSRIE